MTEEFTRRFKNEEMVDKVREIGNTMLECFLRNFFSFASPPLFLKYLCVGVNAANDDLNRKK
jgi:hypothetical protein